MTELSREIFANYQIRKTKKQKQAFIDLLSANMQLNIETGGISRNLIVGDVNAARVIFTAHYDTCAVMPLPNFLMPKNIFGTLLYSVLLCALLIAVGAGITLLVGYLTDSVIVTLFSWVICLFGLIALMYVGPANKHTANDNTSGVITLIELMNKLSSEGGAGVAFVFFDNEELGLIGSSKFRQLHKRELTDKLIMNFDCVSDGDNIMLILNSAAKARYDELARDAFQGTPDKTVRFDKALTTLYPSGQAGFPLNIAVAAFKRCFLGLYIDRIHTPRDTVFDERNIELLTSGAARFANGIMRS